MKIIVKTFATVTDITGYSSREKELHDNMTVDILLHHMMAEHPRLEAINDFLLVAVNEEYADRDHVLRDGDRVAIFPPVSGG